MTVVLAQRHFIGGFGNRFWISALALLGLLVVRGGRGVVVQSENDGLHGEVGRGEESRVLPIEEVDEKPQVGVDHLSGA